MQIFERKFAELLRLVIYTSAKMWKTENVYLLKMLHLDVVLKMLHKESSFSKIELDNLSFHSTSVAAASICTAS